MSRDLSHRISVTAAALMLALWAALPAAAQDRPGAAAGGAVASRGGSVVSPVLTIDSEKVFAESDFGKRVAREEQERLDELEAENKEITDALEAEERALTKRRSEMSAEAFRKLADEFDRKVQDIRDRQNAKNRELSTLREAERDRFLRYASGVYERLMREAGAAVILERRSVFASATAIDITDRAVLLLNETIGSGAAPE